MSSAVQLLGTAGRRRSPATMPDFHAGRAPRIALCHVLSLHSTQTASLGERRVEYLATRMQLSTAWRPTLCAPQYGRCGTVPLDECRS
jgi:hypothetical protein